MRAVAAVLAVIVAASAFAQNITSLSGLYVPPATGKSVHKALFPLTKATADTIVKQTSRSHAFNAYQGLNHTFPTENDYGLPLIGTGLPVNIVGSNVYGPVQKVGGFDVHSFSVKSEDAHGLRVKIELHQLREGEELWQINPRSGESQGPFTRADDVFGGVWLPTVFNDEVILAVRTLEPNPPIVAVTMLTHHFRSLASMPAQRLKQSLPDPLDCRVNVNCEEPGEDNVITQLASGAAQVLIINPITGLAGLCSAALINSFETQEAIVQAVQDGGPVFADVEPLLSSANHCFDYQAGVTAEQVAEASEVLWDFQFDVCIPGVEDVCDLRSKLIGVNACGTPEDLLVTLGFLSFEELETFLLEEYVPSECPEFEPVVPMDDEEDMEEEANPAKSGGERLPKQDDPDPDPEEDPLEQLEPVEVIEQIIEQCFPVFPVGPPQILPRDPIECMVERDFILDGALLRLATITNGYDGRFFAGWTRELPEPGEPFLNVSHPAGDPKKYVEGFITQTGQETPVNYGDAGIIINEEQIRTANTFGTGQGGSSGSALYVIRDGEPLIVGNLTSGRFGSLQDLCALVGTGETVNGWASLPAFLPQITPWLLNTRPLNCDEAALLPDSDRREFRTLRHLRALPDPDTNSVVLTWDATEVNTRLNNFIIVRAEDGFPLSPLEGDKIFEADFDDQRFVDDDEVMPGTEYYYSIFSSLSDAAANADFARTIANTTNVFPPPGGPPAPDTTDHLSQEFFGSTIGAPGIFGDDDISLLPFTQLVYTPQFDIRILAESGFEPPDEIMDYFSYDVTYSQLTEPVFPESDEGAFEIPIRDSVVVPFDDPINPLEEFFFNDAFFDSRLDQLAVFTLPTPFLFFGRFYQEVIVSPNGYLAFDGAEAEGIEKGTIFSSESTLDLPSYQNHFEIPRIAFLFSNLSPQTEGRVWGKVTDEKFVITFQEVPMRSSFPPIGNNVQVELFYNGQIRITYLTVNGQGAIVGISDGNGVPLDPDDSSGRTLLTSKLSTFTAPPALSLDPIPIQRGNEGEEITFTASAQAADGGAVCYDVEFVSGLIPGEELANFDDAVIDPVTGAFSWTPAVPNVTGFYDAIVTACALPDGVEPGPGCAANCENVASQLVRFFVGPVQTLAVINDVEVVASTCQNAAQFGSSCRLDVDISFPVDGQGNPIFPAGGIEIIWYRNGSFVNALFNEFTVNSFATREGEEWFCVVTPLNGAGFRGEPVVSNPITIGPPDGEASEGAGAESLAAGDVNGDGKTDAIDIQAVINAVLGIDASLTKSADVNGDAELNATDVQLVINRALGLAK